jgi:NifU-like protein involved in Fe-S cluster formation
MSDALYAKALLRWAADVSHAGRLDGAQSKATEANPMCGDRCHMTFRLDGRMVAEARHDTRACALTQASASILAAHAAGETAESVAALRASVAGMLASDGAALPEKWSVYGIFAGAAAHKSRHTCVLLPLEAAVKALGATPTQT